jgi:hypothetical protein
MGRVCNVRISATLLANKRPKRGILCRRADAVSISLEGVNISYRSVDSSFACHGTEGWSSDIRSS